MLGYVLDAAAGPGLQGQLAMPQPAPAEALIRVLRSGVCSTDLEMILGYKDGFQGVLGHEFVGVVESGTAQQFALIFLDRSQFRRQCCREAHASDALCDSHCAPPPSLSDWMLTTPCVAVALFLDAGAQ